MVAVECPRMTCTAFTSAPAAMRSDAAVCRRSWIVVPSTPPELGQLGGTRAFVTGSSRFVVTGAGSRRWDV
jgi:hypothetical protein